ncbi:MAG: alcohol dehydrogenase, partial [Alphaproteobacteria bacterium]
LMAVAVAKALGAQPVVMVGTRANRNRMALELGADIAIDAKSEDPVARVKELTGGKGADYVIDCAGTGITANQAVRMTNRGGRICLAAFPKEAVEFELGQLAVNNIYLYGIRGEGRSATHRAMALMAQKRFDATKIHTHTFPMSQLPTAIRYARDRVDDAIKVVVSNRIGQD